MKEKKFYSSLGLLLLLNLIIKPLWIFAIDRQVQNAVGVLEYGRYFSLFNLSVVLGFLLDWGFTVYFNRQLASQQEGFIENAGNFLFLKLFFAIVYIIVVVAVAFFTGIKRWDIVWGVVLIQVFTFLFVFFRAIITAQQWFATDAWLSVLDKTLMIILCGSLLYLPSVFGVMTINKFLWVQTTCTALAMLSALVIIFRRGISFTVHPLQSFLNSKLFIAVLPYTVITLLMAVHYRLDGFLLERIAANGAYEAGIYASAYRLLDISNMAAVLFASFLLPYIARLWNSGKKIDGVILNTRHFLLVFSIAVASMVFFLAPWIQDVLYKHYDPRAIEVLQLCLPSLIGYSLVSLYGTILTAAGYIRSFCVITFFAVIVNVMLNLLLIPSLGAKGSCIAALISQPGCGIFIMLYTNKKTGIKLQPGSLLIYIFIGVVVSALFYWGQYWPIAKWGLIVAAAMMAILIMIATRLLKPGEWLVTLRKPDY